MNFFDDEDLPVAHFGTMLEQQTPRTEPLTIQQSSTGAVSGLEYGFGQTLEPGQQTRDSLDAEDFIYIRPAPILVLPEHIQRMNAGDSARRHEESETSLHRNGLNAIPSTRRLEPQSSRELTQGQSVRNGPELLIDIEDAVDSEQNPMLVDRTAEALRAAQTSASHLTTASADVNGTERLANGSGAPLDELY